MISSKLEEKWITKRIKKCFKETVGLIDVLRDSDLKRSFKLNHIIDKICYKLEHHGRGLKKFPNLSKIKVLKKNIAEVRANSLLILNLLIKIKNNA